MITIAGRVARSDAARLGAEVDALLGMLSASAIVCDVGAVIDADAAVVDGVCRMQLAARRHGCRLEIRGASVALQELLYLTGLTNVVPVRQAPEGAA